MKLGDFSNLAKFYHNRPGYSIELLQVIKDHIEKQNMQEDIKADACVWGGGQTEIVIADVGAGTGKLTENLASLGLSGFAVEPNDNMRTEGIKNFEAKQKIQWIEGAAEETNLEDNSVNWVTMGSSFHWADSAQAIREFYRILKPGGFFTAIWNPRDIESSSLHMKLEDIIYAQLPDMKRVSSGKSITMEQMKEKLLQDGLFGELIYMEAMHNEVMSVERYMNTWKSVNDIQAQAGPEKFKRILNKIYKEIKDMKEIQVPYRSRAWTVKSMKTPYL